MISQPAVREKLRELRTILSGTGPLLVAYSGGVDSTFLLAEAAGVLGDRALGERKRRHELGHGRRAAVRAGDLQEQEVLTRRDRVGPRGIFASAQEAAQLRAELGCRPERVLVHA